MRPTKILVSLGGAEVAKWLAQHRAPSGRPRVEGYSGLVPASALGGIVVELDGIGAGIPTLDEASELELVVYELPADAIADALLACGTPAAGHPSPAVLAIAALRHVDAQLAGLASRATVLRVEVDQR